MNATTPKDRSAPAGTAARVPAVLRRSPLLLFTGLTIAVFGVLRPEFLSITGFLDIGQQIAVVAIIAFAMTAVIVGRGIDISVGATLAVSGVVAARLLDAGLPAPLAMAGAVLTGAAIGTLNGLLIGMLGVSPLLATLGTMALGNGAALALSEASSIPVDNTMMTLPGGSYFAGVPTSLIIAVVCMVAWMLVLRYTLYGRWLFAVGGNLDAARASLAPARLVQMSTYTFAGAFAGLGAIIMIGRVGSAQPLGGEGLEFAAITAAVVGGAKLGGGIGSAGGTMIGAVFVGVITAGLSFLQIPQQSIYVITGLLVIVAVLATQRTDLTGELRRLSGLRGLRRGGGAPKASTTAGTRRELSLTGIGKEFPGVRALHDVTFRLRAGEVVALAGENGAGKSTLVKILAGVQEPDSGRIELDGAPVRLRTADDARAAGVSVIHQHFSVVPDLTVLQNLFLGREPTRFSVLRLSLMRSRAEQLFADLELDIDPDTPLAALTVGEQQLVEVAKAMLDDSWLVIMDEPTSALSNRERERLYTLVRRLTQRDVAILYISHKMEEIFELCDRVVVLRDGEFIAERATSDTTEDELIATMVGRTVEHLFPHRATTPGDVVLDIEGISDGGRLREAGLRVRAGEVVALAGLMGSGRTEVLRCVAGLDAHTSGRVTVDGVTLPPGNQLRANRAGVAYVPEDRAREGIVPEMSVGDNITLAWLRRHARWGVVPSGTASLVDDSVSRLGIRPPDPTRVARVLSGGNQQKAVLARWLATQPKVLLLDEPTNGVDVGAKAEIHELISELKAAGLAVLMVSSELPEVLGVADRIQVMHGGRTVGELPRGSSEQEVMELAFGRGAASTASS